MEATQANPSPKLCDLVMKGGITSGIVYPGAMQELHAAGYQFRSIGGTSAGAIAAGLAAAAQCGGERGFQRLGEVGEQLAKGGFLLHLFQPSGAAASTLFDLTMQMGKEKSVAGRLGTAARRLAGHSAGRACQGLLLGAAAGVLPGLAATGLGAVVGLDSRSGLLGALAGGLLGGAAGFFAGRVLGSAEALPRLVREALSQENGFGLCAGHDPQGVAHRDGELSDWLGWAVDYLAGKTDGDRVEAGATPLTIGDLRAQSVEFRAMTSNLCEGRPYALPFEKKNFLFREADMRRLFPPHVVDHLLRHAYQGDDAQRLAGGALPDGYHFLPFGDDFPVLLAVRMSLSFPVLISAVPLYKLTDSGWQKLKTPGSKPDPAQDLRRHWFSDGGLSSNFPIHFFDDWVPSHPTFAINLVGAPAGQPLPTPALQPANPPREPDTWSEVTGLGAFFNAIWSTTQNFRDNLQSQLPSYRERIVPVPLTASEGGLNLNMDPQVIRSVMDRGVQAGKALAGFDMDHHLWVRYLSLLRLVEGNLNEFRDGADADATGFDKLCDRQLAAYGSEQRYPYPRDSDWCETAKGKVRGLTAFLETWGPVEFEEHSPRPSGSLRVTSEV